MEYFLSVRGFDEIIFAALVLANLPDAGQTGVMSGRSAPGLVGLLLLCLQGPGCVRQRRCASADW